jgi:hypothetical protein
MVENAEADEVKHKVEVLLPSIGETEACNDSLTVIVSEGGANEPDMRLLELMFDEALLE